MGKILIYIGIFIIVVGVIMHFYPKIPFFGKLPGDIYFKRENFSFYFPLTTSIIVSVVLSVVLLIFSKLK